MKIAPAGIVLVNLVLGLGVGTVVTGCKEKPPETPVVAAPEGEKMTAENAQTQLFEAAKTGDMEKVKEALKVDAKLVSSKDGAGKTPLHEAVAGGQKAVVTALIAAKAGVNAKDSTGATPLHLVANSENKEIAAILLAAKADINARDNNGATPLYVAAMNGQRALLDFLIENKADPSIKAKDGSTAVTAAVKAEKPEIAVYLRNMENVALKAKLDEENNRKKLESQRKRAADGSATAQFDLGKRYLKGDGVEKDEAQAREWLEKAAKNGIATAETMLKEMDAKK